MGAHSPGDPIVGLVVLVLLLALYFLPTAIASSRDHNNLGPIFLLNLILGWTLVGWVVALVWSVANPPGPPPAKRSPPRSEGGWEAPPERYAPRRDESAFQGDDWTAPLVDAGRDDRQARIADLIEGEALSIRSDGKGRAAVSSEDGVIGELERPDAERWWRHSRQGKTITVRVHALGGGTRKKAVVRIVVAPR